MRQPVEKIQVRGSVHDRTQIEFDFDYPMMPQGSQHHVDLYFFTPYSLGINASSYARDVFYKDITNYTRFHTPISRSTEVELVRLLKSYFVEVEQRHMRTDMVEAVSYSIKLLANIVITRMKKIHEELWGFCGRQNDEPLDAIMGRLRSLYDRIEKFRLRFVGRVIPSSLVLSPKVRQAFLQTDEYLSNRLETLLSDMMLRLEELSKNDSVMQAITELRQMAVREMKYRQQHEKLFVNSKKTEQEREYYFYRHSLLKKFLARPLYIAVERRKQESFYRNMAAGTGAGLAALWTQLSNLSTSHVMYKRTFSLEFWLLTFAGVVMYIFKDRIKEVSREYFNERLKKYLPDYRGKLTAEFLTDGHALTKGEVGKYTEYVRYLEEQSLPEEVRFIRKTRARRDIDSTNLESVIHYHKQIALPDRRKKNQLDVESIKDIFRFSVTHFLEHLDNSQKTFTMLSDIDGAAEYVAPKVYHVNIVLRLRSLAAAQEQSGYLEIQHFRLILNKEGIVRLESLIPEGQYYMFEDEP